MLLTTKEVAEKLRVTKRTVYAYIKRGELPAVTFGYRTKRVRQDDLDAFIAKCGASDASS